MEQSEHSSANTAVLSITLRCPKCQQALLVNDPEPDLEIICPSCGVDFPMPTTFSEPLAPGAATVSQEGSPPGDAAQAPIFGEPESVPEAPESSENSGSAFASGELTLPSRGAKKAPAPGGQKPGVIQPRQQSSAEKSPRPAVKPQQTAVPALQLENLAEPVPLAETKKAPVVSPATSQIASKALVLLAGLVLLIVAAGVVYTLSTGQKKVADQNRNDDTQGVDMQKLGTLELGDVAPSVPRAAPELEEFQKAALVAQQALESPSWQEMLSYVRFPKVVKTFMRNYYSGDKRFSPYRNVRFLSKSFSQSKSGRALVSFQVETNEFDRLNLLLEKTIEGYKLDWEIMASYQPMSWEDFRLKRPTKPVRFRAGVIVSDYYDVRLYNKDEYHSFKLTKNPAGINMHAYAKKTSSDGLALFELVQDGAAHEVILDLRYSVGATDSDILEIVKFVQEGWMIDYDNQAENAMSSPK